MNNIVQETFKLSGLDAVDKLNPYINYDVTDSFNVVGLRSSGEPFFNPTVAVKAGVDYKTNEPNLRFVDTSYATSNAYGLEENKFAEMDINDTLDVIDTNLFMGQAVFGKFRFDNNTLVRDLSVSPRAGWRDYLAEKTIGSNDLVSNYLKVQFSRISNLAGQFRLQVRSDESQTELIGQTFASIRGFQEVFGSDVGACDAAFSQLANNTAVTRKSYNTMHTMLGIKDIKDGLDEISNMKFIQKFGTDIEDTKDIFATHTDKIIDIPEFGGGIFARVLNGSGLSKVGTLPRARHILPCDQTHVGYRDRLVDDFENQVSGMSGTRVFQALGLPFTSSEADAILTKGKLISSIQINLHGSAYATPYGIEIISIPATTVIGNNQSMRFICR